MAVIDHPVHEKTRESAGTKWGCWNRPEFSDYYYAPARTYRPDGSFVKTTVKIPHTNSTECRHSSSLTDQKCDGCERRGTGELYSALVRSNSK